jgi:hypothetical protein
LKNAERRHPEELVPINDLAISKAAILKEDVPIFNVSEHLSLTNFTVLKLVFSNSNSLAQAYFCRINKPIERTCFFNNASVYTTQYALSGYSLPERIFEYQRHFVVPG